jgi:TM2 domain-containing membrane protein YozV
MKALNIFLSIALIGMLFLTACSSQQVVNNKSNSEHKLHSGNYSSCSLCNVQTNLGQSSVLNNVTSYAFQDKSFENKTNSIDNSTVLVSNEKNQNSQIELNENIKNHLAASALIENNRGKRFNPIKAIKVVKAVKAATSADNSGGKSQLVALLLAIVIGALGIHRFYLGYVGIGIIQLLTFGGCGVWALIDLIRIAMGDLKPKDGEYTETL